MARPLDNEYRTALLGALDKQLMSSIDEINDYLKEVDQFKSYQSTRRMLLRMAEEGLVSVHTQRLKKNKMLFMKGIVSPHLILRDTDGNLVNLTQFIANVYTAEMPEVLSREAANAIKLWMFDYIVSSDPTRFKGIRDVPDSVAIQKKLKGTLDMLQGLHAFIKHFLDSDLHSPVARQKLARELLDCPDKQVEYLVTKKWLDDGSESS